MKPGAIGLYEEALNVSGATLSLRTARGYALPLQLARWCGPPDGADEELPPPHRPWHDPQVVCYLVNPVAAGEPPGGLQPQPLPPLLLPGGRVPAPLRIPHDPAIRPQPAHITT